MEPIETDPSSPQSPESSRQAYLDHIRVFLTALVIMHHSVITYGASGGWFCKEVASENLSPLTQSIYSLFVTTNQAYFMGLFFLIAGYFTPSSLSRKGAGVYIKDRLVRLGVPLAIFALILAPLTISFARLLVDGGTLFDGFYWIWFMGNYECGPMWFVQALLIFAFVYIIWMKLPFATKFVRDDAPLPSHFTLLIAALATGLIAYGFRFILPVGQSIVGMQVAYFASYIVLFFVGCRAARSRWLERLTFRYVLPWAIVAIVAVALLPFVSSTCKDGSQFLGGWNVYAIFYAMWEPFVAWGIMLSLLYLSRRFFSGTTPFIAGLARCSFAVYVIHAPVLVGVTVLAHEWAAAPLLKALMVGVSSCVVAWVLAAIIVRLPGPCSRIRLTSPCGRLLG